nr:polysaccharide deacetylase family protein [Mesorhizobium camelthorni]
MCEVPSACADGTEDRSVHLTLDDGPNPLCTPQEPRCAGAHRVPATFFVVGAYAADQPELIRSP